MKEPTRSIYNCLEESFWTKRKCSSCQKFFTKQDFQKQNYQLFFKEIGEKKPANSLNYAILAEVIVRLFHKYCPLIKHYPSECQIEIVKDITCSNV